MTKEATDLKECKHEAIGGLGGRKVKGKQSNYIIISKRKERNIFLKIIDPFKWHGLWMINRL